MPSEKLTRILQAISPFSGDEIAAMSDRAGWDWVYTNRKRREPRPEDDWPEICFTGFNNDERSALKQIARDSKLKPVSTVTKHLRYLCTGENPGPAKLEKAREQDVVLIDRAAFERLIHSDVILPLLERSSRAITDGNLLKITYPYKVPWNGRVVKPLAICNDKQGLPDKLSIFDLELSKSRELVLKKLRLLDFEPAFADGSSGMDVPFFQNYFKPHVLPLLQAGWRIDIGDAFIGIYPSAPGDTLTTSKPFSEHKAHIHYIRSADYPFHVWFENNVYFRFENLDDATAYFQGFAHKE